MPEFPLFSQWGQKLGKAWGEGRLCDVLLLASVSNVHVLLIGSRPARHPSLYPMEKRRRGKATPSPEYINAVLCFLPLDAMCNCLLDRESSWIILNCYTREKRLGWDLCIWSKHPPSPFSWEYSPITSFLMAESSHNSHYVPFVVFLWSLPAQANFLYSPSWKQLWWHNITLDTAYRVRVLLRCIQIPCISH